MKAPTLETANKRRYWMVGTMIFENLFFSAVLLGWSSLLPVLLQEGFYSTRCKDGEEFNGNSTDDENSTALYNENGATEVFTYGTGTTEMGELENKFGRPTYPRCTAQDEALNLAFTIGSFMLSGLTFPIGMAMDKFGCRMLRILGAVMFIASCLIFGWTPIEWSEMIIPAVSLNGVGGIMITFTSFQVANLFGNKRSTVISLNIGSYASAAILFLILKSLYDVGISRPQMFTGLAIATMFVIINCFFNVPKEPIPDPEGAAFGMHWQILKVNHKVTGKQFYSMVTNVGRKLSITDEAAEEAKQTMIRRGSKIYSSQLNLAIELKEHKKKKNETSLLRSVCSPIYILSLVVMCVTQLRLLFFIGSLTQSLMKITGNDTETADQYVYIFGMMQIMCLFTSPLIGAVMDYKIRETLQAAKDKEQGLRRRDSMGGRRTSMGGRRGSSNGCDSLAKSKSFAFGDFKRPSISLGEKKLSFTNGETRKTGLPNGDIYKPISPNGELKRPMFMIGGDDNTSTALPTISFANGTKQQLNGSSSNSNGLQRNNSLNGDVELGMMVYNNTTSSMAPLMKQRHPSTSSTSSQDSMNPKPPMSLKIRKLLNASYAFYITSALIMIFGVTVLIPNLQVQILSFILHTVIRGFIHSAVCGLYAITYPASQVGSLIGLQSLISACATLLQYPIFVAIEGPLNKDPFYVNVTLLAMSVLNFGLPAYMMYLGKKLRREQKSESEDEQKLLKSPTAKSALEKVPEEV